MSLTETREIRKFGFIALIFFGSLCVLGIWMHKPLPIYLFGSFSAVGAGFILMPAPLRPVHAVWLKFAHLIGRVVTAMALGLAFYLVITPFGLIKRLFGGRPLPVKPDKDVLSYWVEREEPAQPRERFHKRF